MSLTTFLTAALESALDTGMAAPEDVLRHATPVVLGTSLPRPVWAKLIAACLAAPRTDAKLIVDTVGIGTLCEHVPAPIMWACLSEIAVRALGRGLVAAPPPAPQPVAAPPPQPVPQPVATAPSAPVPTSTPRAPTAPVVPTPSPRAPTAPAVAVTPPLAPAPAVAAPPLDAAGEITRVAAAPLDLAKIAADKSDPRGETTRVGSRPSEPEPLGDPPALPRAPGATSRASQAMSATRRPQASAPASPPKTAPRGTPPPVATRRATTATDFEIETDVSEQWKKPVEAAAVPVDDDQLIDWAQSEETATTGDKYDRKR